MSTRGNNAPRSCNLVMVRGDGQRKNAGSVVIRGGSLWWKSFANADYIRRNNDGLSVNLLVVEVLERWGVQDLYYLLGTGQQRVLYRTTLKDARLLGSFTEHPGWGFNITLPLPLWKVDRSGFNPGWVPDGHDLILPVSDEAHRERPDRPKVVAKLTENVTTRSGSEVHTFTESANVPAQLGLFDVERVA